MIYTDDNLKIWGTIEDNTLEQARLTTKLPFVKGHVALMPDAHVGIGSTIGSVIPTMGAIIPSAIGVDIGCGMIAAETSITASQLPDSLNKLFNSIARGVPAGVGKGHAEGNYDLPVPDHSHRDFNDKQINKIYSQFGSLGSGNHFVEICLDEHENVWVVLHSGSRGIGNELAQKHIGVAKGVMKQYFIDLPSPDLAYLVEGTEPFDAYIADMLWAQKYAMSNRESMMKEVLKDLFYEVPGSVVQTINCHHNYTTKENHMGKNLWLTRKGAIKADSGDLGVIPGSMGTSSYITRGLGNKGSYNSSSHGAGRRLSRTAAKKVLTETSLEERMVGKTWNNDAKGLLDEHPDAYKDIERVMDDQKDLTEIVHTLNAVLNYKGI